MSDQVEKFSGPSLEWLHEHGLWPDDCPTKEHKGGYCCLCCDHDEPGADCACFEILEGIKLWKAALGAASTTGGEKK